MTRPRRVKTTAGRSQYQMRMPFPGNFAPDNVMANFREIARWANELPIPSDDTFVPYFFKYAPEDPQEVWDENLVTIMQSTFTTDLMPSGVWLVAASLAPTNVPVGAVGIDARLLVNGPNVGTPSGSYESIGYMDGEAIRVVDDLAIDFTLETFDITYKWFLPPVDGGLMNAIPPSFNLVVINAAEDDIAIQGEARYATIIDPDVGPDLDVAPVDSFLYVWAYRLSDGYSIPTTFEDITPP